MLSWATEFASEGAHGWSWRAVDLCWTRRWRTTICWRTCLFTGDGREWGSPAMLLQKMVQKDAYQVSRGRRIAVICDIGPDCDQQRTSIPDPSEDSMS